MILVAPGQQIGSMMHVSYKTHNSEEDVLLVIAWSTT